jgi:hypothetical protein
VVAAGVHGVERHRQRLLGLGVDHLQGLEEIIDPVDGDGQLELAVADHRPALEVRDTIAIDDHFAERGMGLDRLASCAGAQRQQ